MVIIMRKRPSILHLHYGTVNKHALQYTNILVSQTLKTLCLFRFLRSPVRHNSVQNVQKETRVVQRRKSSKQMPRTPTFVGMTENSRFPGP